MVNEKMISTKEIEERFNISQEVLSLLRKSGELPFKKISKKTILYKEADILKLFNLNNSDKSSLVFYIDDYQKILLQNYLVSSGKLADCTNDWKEVMNKICNSEISNLYIANEMVLPIYDYQVFKEMSKSLGVNIKSLNLQINSEDYLSYGFNKISNFLKELDLNEFYKSKLQNSLNIIRTLKEDNNIDKPNTIFIYVIVDSRGNNNVKDYHYYIGSTKLSLKKRLRNHKDKIKGTTDMRFYNLVRQFSNLNNLCIHLLEEVPDDLEVRNATETYYIRLYMNMYGKDKVYNELDTARNYDNPQYFNKFMNSGKDVVHQRTFFIKKMLNSNCMVLKYKEDGDVMIGKKSLWEFLQKLYPDFTLKYSAFKMVCDTGKLSQKVWNNYGRFLKDIYFLEKETETWKSILEIHNIDKYCQRSGSSIERRTKFRGHVNLDTLEWQPSKNKIRRNRKSNNS